MSWLISDALAAGTTANAPPDNMLSMLMMGGIFIVFYFFIIRPQSKKAKEHRELVSKIKVGDEVVVAGGILAEVKKLSDQFIVLMLNDAQELIVQRASISAVLPKGTLNNIKKS